MDNEMKIRKELFAKMSNDYNTYIENLKNSSIDNILDNAYEKVMKENILSEFTPEFEHYNMEQIKALNSCKEPLNKLYKKWFKEDNGVHNLLEDSIFDTLQNIVKEQKNRVQER